MRRLRQCWLLLLLYAVFHSREVQAQSLASTTPLRPKAFAELALTVNSRDLDARMRLAQDASRLGWFITAGIPVKGKLALGVEFGGPSDATGETAGNSFVSKGRQRERLLMGTLRFRAAGTESWAVDVLAGAGVLFHHNEALLSSCGSCTDFSKETSDHAPPSFVAGIDAFRTVRGPVSVGAVVRYHALTRGTAQSDAPVLVPWQFEWKSSSRFSIGLGIRVSR